MNRAARLMAVAHGGQIVVSHATEELVRDELADGVELVDLGEHRLRDLARPERVFQVGRPGLADDFPPLRSLDALSGNLPASRRRSSGASEELQEIAERARATRRW